MRTEFFLYFGAGFVAVALIFLNRFLQDILAELRKLNAAQRRS